MDEFLDDFDEIQEVIDMADNVGGIPGAVRPLRRRKTYHRPPVSPLEQFDENTFRNRYRFTKATVVNVILPEIITDLEKHSNRGLPIEPLLQLLICLRFYATGCFQAVCADLGGISQPTVCLIVSRVSRILALKLLKFVKFENNPAGISRYVRGFEELGRIGPRQGLKGIIGAIDCTHIRIARPRNCPDTERFRNRKGYFSLNVQVVCSPQMEILDIVSRWPGSTHDSRIFANSRFRSKLHNNLINGILVGDSGYASARYMLTPLINPRTPAEERYNKCQIKTRNVIERVFGVWKRRFPCLQKGMANDIKNVTNIILACAALHNIAIHARDTWEHVAEDHNEDFGDNVGPQEQPIVEGLAFRNHIIRRDFE